MQTMMRLETPQLGTLHYEEKEVIRFPEGLYGFEKLKHFLLVSGEKDSIFDYLQSIDDVQVTFILSVPNNVVDNYVLTIPQEDIEKIQASGENDIQDYVIVTLPKKIEEISVNLLGPIIINKRLNIGFQFVSENSEYSTKHKILEQVKTKVC